MEEMKEKGVDVLKATSAESLSAREGKKTSGCYGFVDFDSPAAAQKAVASLKASGVQAQMAKFTLRLQLLTMMSDAKGDASVAHAQANHFTFILPGKLNWFLIS
ncbi:unnamed protein product [Arctogadus glacialis]